MSISCLVATSNRGHTNLDLLDHQLAKGANLGGAGDVHLLAALVLTGDAVESARVVGQRRVQIGPEFDQKESTLRAFIIELLESLLLGKLVVNLPDLHRLQHRVGGQRQRLSNVHEEMLVAVAVRWLHEGRELHQPKLVGGDRAALEEWTEAVGGRQRRERTRPVHQVAELCTLGKVELPLQIGGVDKAWGPQLFRSETKR